MVGGCKPPLLDPSVRSVPSNSDSDVSFGYRSKLLNLARARNRNSGSNPSAGLAIPQRTIQRRRSAIAIRGRIQRRRGGFIHNPRFCHPPAKAHNHSRHPRYSRTQNLLPLIPKVNEPIPLALEGTAEVAAYGTNGGGAMGERPSEPRAKRLPRKRQSSSLQFRFGNHFWQLL